MYYSISQNSSDFVNTWVSISTTLVDTNDTVAYNMQQISMELFAAMGVEEPQRYLAQSQQPMSANPISENMAAMKGMPLQAQMDQNHDAHIVTHGTILRNPAYKENPQY